MIIEIMSREKILEYSHSKHDEKIAVISISNHGEDFPSLLESKLTVYAAIIYNI